MHFWFVSENIYTLIIWRELGLSKLRRRCSCCNGVTDTWILSFTKSCGDDGSIRVLLTLWTIRRLRVIRFFRLIKALEELWLIVQGLMNSINTLMWVALLLILVMYI